MRWPNTFLLRCWRLGSQEERIQIEHVQSGTTVLARSLAAALEWIGTQDNETALRVEDDGAAGRTRDSTSQKQ